VIVRLMEDGQYELDSEQLSRLDELDAETVVALDAHDAQRVSAALSQMWSLVQANGTRIPDSELVPSDAVIPPADLSLEEARRMLGEEGFIPDVER